MEGVGAQSKERKGSNFAIWQPWFKVNVYTRDFCEEEEVRRVEQSIVSNLSVPPDHISMLTYKPEIYSHLDIYAGNKFGSQGRGIRASMYQSKSANSRYLGRQRRQ